jgi:hypothetical protein
MKELYTYALLTCFMILPSEAFTQVPEGQEPTLLYTLYPGERFQMDIDLQQNTHSEDMNNQEISMFSKMKLDFLVDSVVAPGLVYMTVQYQDLLLSMLAPSMGVDINSGTGKNMLLSSMVESLEKKYFKVEMTLSGELRSLEGLGEIFQDLYAMPVSDTNEQKVILNTLGEVYGPNAFRSMFSLFVSVYPVVQPMQNWTRDITYYFNTKPVQLVNRYHLAKTTEEETTIQGIGMLNSTEEVAEITSMGSVKSSVSGSQTYDFQMDINTGWIRRCVSRQRVMIETVIVKSAYLPTGLKIPSYTETVFEVKGSRIQ